MIIRKNGTKTDTTTHLDYDTLIAVNERPLKMGG